MDVRQKYLEENDYYLSHEFSEFIRLMGADVSSIICDTIDNTIYQIGNSKFAPCDWGMRIEIKGTTNYFCLRVGRAHTNDVIFDGMRRISLDEYLDLMNLNRYFDEHLHRNNRVN